MPEHIWIKAIPTLTGYTSFTSQSVLTKHAGMLILLIALLPYNSDDLNITIGETRPDCVISLGKQAAIISCH